MYLCYGQLQRSSFLFWVMNTAFAIWNNTVVLHYDTVLMFSLKKQQCCRQGSMLLGYCTISVFGAKNDSNEATENSFNTPCRCLCLLAFSSWDKKFWQNCWKVFANEKKLSLINFNGFFVLKWPIRYVQLIENTRLVHFWKHRLPYGLILSVCCPSGTLPDLVLTLWLLLVIH